MMPRCEVWQLGLIPYQTAWDLQDQLVRERSQPGTPDRLVLVQHPHVYTLGSSGHDENLLLSDEERERRGIDIFRIDRGGDVTYHGPGQIVGYPIIQLPRGENLRLDVRGYVRNLEMVIIRVLGDYGIPGKLIDGCTGVWVDTPEGEAKVCAIGVKINVKAVTKHGFALNVNTDMSYFEGIIPCGITDKGVTNMAALLGSPVDEAEISQRIVAHFGEVFGYEMQAVEKT
jgi:lipoyl(octanoyl) transferase